MYAVVFGTRPEYLKLLPLVHELKLRSIPYRFIYVKQHKHILEDLETSVSIDIDEHPDRLNSLGSQILERLPSHLEGCSRVIVQGDTSTAFYSALTAYQMKKPVIHIEAGLRTYTIDSPYPEEGYRQMISRIASMNFSPHEDSTALLDEELVYGRSYTVGNTILDLVKSYNLEPYQKDIVVITFHRRENWSKVDTFISGLKELIKVTNVRYLWYLHPNPELQAKVRSSLTTMDSVELCEPLNHYEFTKQLSQCNFVITDSGGIQEEATFLGKHCIVLRSSTERDHISKEYITLLEDYSTIADCYLKSDKIMQHKPCLTYGSGNACKDIVDILRNS